MFGFKKKNSLSFRKKIFKHTDKPIEYIHVDKPKTKQDYRQIHFNNWCKAKEVYCGSYLPKNPYDLSMPNKGWEKPKIYEDGKKLLIKRKSTGQVVQYHYEDESKKDRINHYHWEINDKKLKKKNRFNRKKQMCRKHSEESHILPYDYEYKKNDIQFLKIKIKHRE